MLSSNDGLTAEIRTNSAAELVIVQEKEIEMLDALFCSESPRDDDSSKGRAVPHVVEDTQLANLLQVLSRTDKRGGNESASSNEEWVVTDNSNKGRSKPRRDLPPKRRGKTEDVHATIDPEVHVDLNTSFGSNTSRDVTSLTEEAVEWDTQSENAGYIYRPRGRPPSSGEHTASMREARQMIRDAAKESRSLEEIRDSAMYPSFPHKTSIRLEKEERRLQEEPALFLKYAPTPNLMTTVTEVTNVILCQKILQS